MLANSYKYEQGILPVEVANALNTSSMELNIDLQPSLATCYCTVTFNLMLFIPMC